MLIDNQKEPVRHDASRSSRRGRVIRMPFVKLDCGMLDSTLWVDREARELFVTALLMAEPRELRASEPQLEIRSLKETGFIVPAGWYGFVPAAGSGIVRRSGMPSEAGLSALERLGSPDQESRSPEFDGRRLARINGGFVILNFNKYRERDYTTAERSARYRARRAEMRGSNGVTALCHGVTPRHVTQAEAEAEAEAEVDPSTTCPAGAVHVEVTKASPADEVFAHYQTHHPRARVLGADERKKINARLKEGFTVADLCSSIDGQHRSPHHLGQNKDGRQYLSLELAVRDSSKVNQFLAMPSSGAAGSVIERVLNRMDGVKEDLDGPF